MSFSNLTCSLIKLSRCCNQILTVYPDVVLLYRQYTSAKDVEDRNKTLVTEDTSYRLCRFSKDPQWKQSADKETQSIDSLVGVLEKTIFYLGYVTSK